jgi:hypothetical protein
MPGSGVFFGVLKMSIRIPITLSPHSTNNGKPGGYYVLAQRLFPNGAPVLAKQQWVGFSDGLVITVQHPGDWNSLLKMAINRPMLNGHSVTWLSPVHLYPMTQGFRVYIPKAILEPPAEAQKKKTTGLFCRSGNLYWLKIPAVSGDVLLERKEL